MFTKLLRNPIFSLLLLIVCSPILAFGIVLFWLVSTVGAVFFWILFWPIRLISGLVFSVLGGGGR